MPKASQVSAEADIVDEENDGNRATALLAMFISLSSQERVCFGAVLNVKMKVQSDLEAFLSDREKGTAPGAEEEAHAAMRRSLFRLSTTLPPVAAEKKSMICDKLLSVKDRHVFTRLESVLSRTHSVQEHCKIRDEARQRVESRSPLGEYLGLLYDTAGPMIVNSGTLKIILNFASETSVTDNETIAALVSQLVKFFPKVLSDCAGELTAWLSTSLSNAQRQPSSKPVLQEVLTILDKVAPSLLTLETSYKIPVSKGKAGRKSIVEAGMNNGASSSSGKGISGSSPDDVKELFSMLLSEALKQREPALCERFALAASPLAGHEGKSEINAAVKGILSQKKLSLSNDRVVCDMSVLAKLIGSSDHLTESTLGKVSEFVKERLLVSGEDDDDDDNAKSSGKSKASPGKSSSLSRVSVACHGLKCWTAIFVLYFKYETGILDLDTLKFYADELLDIVYGCLDSGGSSLGDLTTVSEAQRTSVRESAACCAFEMLKVEYISKSLPVERWHRLGWCLLEPNPQALFKIANVYGTLIQTTGLHIRYLAFSCLLAVDDRLAGHSKQSLVFALKRLRTTHENLIGRAMVTEDKALISHAEDVIPECVLPYALHLLAHYPSEGHGAKYLDERNKHMVMSIRHIFTSLKESLRADADNLSYLLEQVNLISRRFRDRFDENTKPLLLVSQMARQLLQEEIKTVENTQPYKGRINIPADLFVVSSNTTEFTGEQDDAAERAVRAVPKGKSQRATQQQHQHVPSAAAGIAKKRVAAVVSRTAATSDSDSDSEKMHKKTAKSPMKKSAAASGRPQRAVATKPVSYREISESDKEVSRWEESLENKHSSSREKVPRASIDETENDKSFGNTVVL